MNLKTRTATKDDLPFAVTLRFGALLLACVLLALSGGHSLTTNIANVCYLFGLSGLAFYFCLEFTANQRIQSQANAARNSAEQRLSRRMRIETKAALLHQQESAPQEPSAGSIESAMDSQADLDTFLGMPTQPTLSV